MAHKTICIAYSLVKLQVVWNINVFLTRKNKYEIEKNQIDGVEKKRVFGLIYRQLNPYFIHPFQWPQLW